MKSWHPIPVAYMTLKVNMMTGLNFIIGVIKKSAYQQCTSVTTKKNPLKWAFPKNATISAGTYLIVWADGDQADYPGLHANFKLSKNGETVMLVDTSGGVNQILSLVEFGNQIENSSIGRYPNGSGPFRTLKETPKKGNKL